MRAKGRPSLGRVRTCVSVSVALSGDVDRYLRVEAVRRARTRRRRKPKARRPKLYHLQLSVVCLLFRLWTIWFPMSREGGSMLYTVCAAGRAIIRRRAACFIRYRYLLPSSTVRLQPSLSLYSESQHGRFALLCFFLPRIPPARLIFLAGPIPSILSGSRASPSRNAARPLRSSIAEARRRVGTPI